MNQEEHSNASSMTEAAILAEAIHTVANRAVTEEDVRIGVEKLLEPTYWV